MRHATGPADRRTDPQSGRRDGDGVLRVRRALLALVAAAYLAALISSGVLIALDALLPARTHLGQCP